MSTFTVTNANNSGAGSLRQGILDANALSGKDIINFGGLFTDGLAHTISLTGSGLSITDSLTIQGTNPSLLTIKDDTADRVFDIGKGVTAAINGLTITNSYDGTGGGGGIFNEGFLALSNSIIKGNTVTMGTGSYGGGIYNTGSLSVNYSTISDNTANGSSDYGGGIYNKGSLTVNHSTISYNTAAAGTFGYGGGIYNDRTATVTVSNSTISYNTAKSSTFGFGGGIYNDGIATVSKSTINDNTANGGSGSCGGGGIANGTATTATATVSNCTISDNTANGHSSFGGGIYNNLNGTATVSNSTISYNAANGGSGSGSGFGEGGGIYNDGTAAVSNSTISYNTAKADFFCKGGGIYNVNGTATLSNSTISYNTAKAAVFSDGGGIYNYYYATVTIRNCAISGNEAHFGGGIYNDSTLTVGNSIIRHNKAFGIELSSGREESGDGGGIYNSSYGTATVDYSTITCNFDTPQEDSTKVIKSDDLVGKFITKHHHNRIGNLSGSTFSYN